MAGLALQNSSLATKSVCLNKTKFAQVSFKPVSAEISPATFISSYEKNPKRASRIQVAASLEEAKVITPSSLAPDEKTKFHFLVANAKFMLDDEEHFQEVMRERQRHFKEIGREQDFWLLYEPEFLESFPEITKRLSRPAVALISTDELWITFMKLRLDRVLRGKLNATLSEALSSKPVDITFEKPKEWVAPYSKYEGPWWNPFLPSSASQN